MYIHTYIHTYVCHVCMYVCMYVMYVLGTFMYVCYEPRNVATSLVLFLRRGGMREGGSVPFSPSQATKLITTTSHYITVVQTIFEVTIHLIHFIQPPQ